MFKRRNLIKLALVAFLCAGNVFAYANTPNDLLKMDVKRSSMNDAVDVTFYTTGSATNSVVTRKGANRYVVLLPNVSGSQSVAPALGGVKDLISNIEVKNIDDGIGGYTKVTFTTTKPLKIQTSTQKTAPLTSAQQDYKNLIAKNSIYDANNKMKNLKSNNNSSAEKPVSQKAQTSMKQEIAKTTGTKAQNSVKPAVSNKVTESKKTQSAQKTISNPSVKTETAQSSKIALAIGQNVEQISNNTPKMKFDENGNRQIDLEPKVNHKVGAEKPLENTDSASEVQSVDSSDNIKNSIEENKSEKQKQNKTLPIIPLTGALSVLGIFMFLALLNIISRSVVNKSRDFNLSANEPADKSAEHKQEMENIIKDKSLNWQEKYKRYSQKDKEYDMQTSKTYSYIADVSVSDTKEKSEITPKQKAERKTAVNIMKKSVSNKTNSKPQTKKEVLDVVTSQLEHSFKQVQSVMASDDVKKELISEDSIMSDNISNIKLKSFAKNNIEQSDRLLSKKKKSVSNPMREGRFVKLRNSALSMSKRNSAASGVNISDLLRTGRKYLDNQSSGVIKMDSKKENYALSSLDEYLSILNTEDEVRTKTSESVAKTLSQIKSGDVMSRSGITNPIEKTKHMSSSEQTPSIINGLVVKSGYNIDNERGFYLVNLDGISALVGRIKDDIFVLKKFDKNISGTLQVRLDYGSVYIVRVGGFKCLVDVAENKMGTLLEI